MKVRGKIRHHLLGLNASLRTHPYRRAHFHDVSQRLAGFLEGVRTTAELGHKALDRLSLAQERFSLKLKGRSSTSRPPDLGDLILSRSVVSVPLAAKALT